MAAEQTPASLAAGDDLALADRLRDGRTAIMGELRKLIIGQEAVPVLPFFSLVLVHNTGAAFSRSW